MKKNLVLKKLNKINYPNQNKQMNQNLKHKLIIKMIFKNNNF